MVQHKIGRQERPYQEGGRFQPFGRHYAAANDAGGNGGYDDKQEIHLQK